MFDNCDMKVDYKKMYHIMMNATEKAMELLIQAQRECEELYINASVENREDA